MIKQQRAEIIVNLKILFDISATRLRRYRTADGLRYPLVRFGSKQRFGGCLLFRRSQLISRQTANGPKMTRVTVGDIGCKIAVMHQREDAKTGIDNHRAFGTRVGECHLISFGGD